MRRFNVDTLSKLPQIDYDFWKIRHRTRNGETNKIRFCIINFDLVLLPITSSFIRGSPLCVPISMKWCEMLISNLVLFIFEVGWKTGEGWRCNERGKWALFAFAIYKYFTLHTKLRDGQGRSQWGGGAKPGTLSLLLFFSLSLFVTLFFLLFLNLFRSTSLTLTLTSKLDYKV